MKISNRIGSGYLNSDNEKNLNYLYVVSEKENPQNIFAQANSLKLLACQSC